MELSIIKTLSYFDIFDYPLTFSEIKKYLRCEIEYSDDELQEIIGSIATIQESNGYYYLLGRQEIAIKRSERGNISIPKYAKAKIMAKILSFVPTIEYIGLSGSLSMNNSAVSDDIDFFFVTKKNTLWISRFIVNAILFVTSQKRRNKSESYVQDKICPNMFVEKQKLGFSGKKRTIYTAHEILQLKTLFDRNDTYATLLNKNRWVKDYIPNVTFPKRVINKENILQKIVLLVLLPVERIFYVAQLLYMRKKRSIEIVAIDRALLHPIDRQKLILDMYDLRYKRYKKMYEDNIWIDKDEARFYMEEKKIRILN